MSAPMSPLLVLVIAAVCLILGVFFGLMLGERFGQRFYGKPDGVTEEVPKKKRKSRSYLLKTVIEGIDKYEGRSPWPDGPWKSSDRVALLMTMLSATQGITAASAFQKGSRMGDPAKTDGGYYLWLMALVDEGIARREDRNRPHTFYRRTDAGRIEGK